jgi:hypothetical protein
MESGDGKYCKGCLFVPDETPLDVFNQRERQITFLLSLDWDDPSAMQDPTLEKHPRFTCSGST